MRRPRFGSLSALSQKPANKLGLVLLISKGNLLLSIHCDAAPRVLHNLRPTPRPGF